MKLDDARITLQVAAVPRCLDQILDIAAGMVAQKLVIHRAAAIVEDLAQKFRNDMIAFDLHIIVNLKKASLKIHAPLKSILAPILSILIKPIGFLTLQLTRKNIQEFRIFHSHCSPRFRRRRTSCRRVFEADCAKARRRFE